jgi:non-specific protein-tyrosine kinase
LLGGLLGVGLAWLRDRLDTRVQEPDEVAHELGMPLLASVPTLPRRMRDTHDLVMLSEPHGPLSEAFRIMRTNFDFATIDGHIKTVMVTSSVSGEGKSTTAANLALAFARSGRRVILVDLDLRRPYIARFFNLTGLPGLTDVALGNASLDDALTPIDVDTGAVLTELSATARNGKPRDAISAAMGGANNADGAGTNLRVLASGPMPPDTGEFLSSSWLNEVLSDLTRRADIVLVDATPLLGVSDALTLMAHVDAVLFIARLQVIRRSMFRDLRRLLASSPARVVGCVAVGVASGPGYGYGYGYGYLATNDRVAPSADADSRVGLPPVGSKPR